ARGPNGWGTPVVVVNGVDVGANPFLVMENDLARIAYWDRANWDVHSAWQCTNLSWGLATIDAAPVLPAPDSEPGPAWLGLGASAPVVYYPDFFNSHVKDATYIPTVISDLATAFGTANSASRFTLPDDCSGDA